MADTAIPDNDALVVEPVRGPEDITEAYDCVSEAFGRQTRDGIWTAFNPGWDTPAGKVAGAGRLVQRWRSTTADYRGNANEVFLKATLPDPDPAGSGRRIIVGFAIWAQVSAVPGYGDVTARDFSATMNLDALYPGDETEQRFLRQMLGSLLRRRLEFVGERAAANPPSVMALDLCTTHPAFQRRGIGAKLVQWGLDEAHRRGIPYAVTEASSMGRVVYERLGFRPQGADIEYELDDEFKGRDQPANVFMLYSRF